MNDFQAENALRSPMKRDLNQSWDADVSLARPKSARAPETLSTGRGCSAAFLIPAVSAHQAVYSTQDYAELNQLVTVVAPPLTDATLDQHRSALGHVEALFTGWDSPSLDARRLALFPRLRVVFHAGGSVKFMVTEEFWARGIRLTSAAKANAIPVAEFTIAQIVLALKKVWTAAYATREARRFVRPDFATPTAYGTTVGILSFGHIGRKVADRLRAFDVRVIGHDPFLSDEDAASLGVERCSLADVFRRSDVVTCHTPLLPETTQLLRGVHFSSMKLNATFINTARGPIVHETELISVLARRPDLVAMLDVTDPEPPTKDSPLYRLPNVMLTPHLSGSVGPECQRMGRMMVDELRRYLAGQPLSGEVRREQLPHLA